MTINKTSHVPCHFPV